MPINKSVTPKYINGTQFVTKSVEANEEVMIVCPDEEFEINNMYFVVDPQTAKGFELFECDFERDFDIKEPSESTVHFFPFSEFKGILTARIIDVQEDAFLFNYDPKRMKANLYSLVGSFEFNRVDKELALQMIENEFKDKTFK
jgi:hypothetical protein